MDTLLLDATLPYLWLFSCGVNTEYTVALTDGTVSYPSRVHFPDMEVNKPEPIPMQDDVIDDDTRLGVSRIVLSSWWTSTKHGNREWPRRIAHRDFHGNMISMAARSRRRVCSWLADRHRMTLIRADRSWAARGIDVSRSYSIRALMKQPLTRIISPSSPSQHPGTARLRL